MPVVLETVGIIILVTLTVGLIYMLPMFLRRAASKIFGNNTDLKVFLEIKGRKTNPGTISFGPKDTIRISGENNVILCELRRNSFGDRITLIVDSELRTTSPDSMILEHNPGRVVEV
jgi:hypothetical protein